MFDINVMGFPKTIKKPHVYQLLKTVIFGRHLKCKFWVCDIFPVPDSDFVQVVVSVMNKSDAYKAVELINNFIYFNGKENFRLSSIVASDYDLPSDNEDTVSELLSELAPQEQNRDRESRSTGKQPESTNLRSRSPHINLASAEVDKKIELVRKQRLLVVEERQLLLEKKRLELLQKFGEGSIQDLEMFAATVDKCDNELSQPENLETPHPPLDARQFKTAKANLESLLRDTIIRRVDELIQKKAHLESGDMDQLYRETYPEDTDEKLMEQFIAVVVAGDSDEVTEDTCAKSPTGTG